MKIYLTSHLDGGNRGCEAITKGTATIISLDLDNIIAFSKDRATDKFLKIDDFVRLNQLKMQKDLFHRFYRKVRRQITDLESEKAFFSQPYNLKLNLDTIESGSVAFSTGGDTFCYGDTYVIYINNILHKRGIKTVLWGCSIGKENLTEEKIDTLKKFSLITARESLTESMLKGLGLKNVYCFPDPAFVLRPTETTLPYCFKNGKDVVGINLSNFVGKNVGFDSIRGKNFIGLVDKILDSTDFNILLIPHVFWKGQDDRIVCKAVFDKYKSTNRVFLLESEKLNYCEIRYIISKCRFFVGARTHSIISAYSMQVPALALGYSAKSIGIAKDVGLDSKLVVNSNDLKSELDFADGFSYLLEHEDEIREVYKEMPNYIAKAFEAKSVVDQLLSDK